MTLLVVKIPIIISITIKKTKVIAAQWIEWNGITFWNPFNSLGGSLACKGKPKYNWATSLPATEPVFCKVILMVLTTTPEDLLRRIGLIGFGETE